MYIDLSSPLTISGTQGAHKNRAARN